MDRGRLDAWARRASRERPARRSHKALAVLTAAGTGVALSRSARRTSDAPRAAYSVRDWGGRRGRMHSEGTRLSDVWADLDVAFDDPAPFALVARLAAMWGGEGDRTGVVVVPSALRMPSSAPGRDGARVERETAKLAPLLGRATQSDCLELLRSLPASPSTLPSPTRPTTSRRSTLRRPTGARRATTSGGATRG